ncbi:MAG: DHH family phosphoesterase [Alkalibacterium gilvum]|uniref:DHH family phosphoesterase n=1 Tax=Alkalibacterium TaxID=99906 RepID=UPI0026484590|nr:DHH family phosphoesterase [Alkalibacterium sp.]MDN6193967.1 DHH family phosphoesterase [Alkalibacterium sp.]MDN6293169.1 DHH family phosphoesterase [Alkalibacterium sp.]MDN6294810.1 DHH family phosphoesterase [Alkalibacterium sp.]MDN6397465.1 DHH family phosphoesterase [Alkalibacterium sp.]MDN6729660.1 DHH family phosphoesterase [Alkalibacterium sp.]
MNNKSQEDNLPKLLNHPYLKRMLLFAVAVQFVMTALSFFAHIWLGVLMLILFLITLAIIWQFSNEYNDELNNYILNLSYRIKRGQQEALIKMPMGIILLNDENQIEWINPYMQLQLPSEQQLLGEPIKEVNQDLSDYFENDKREDFNLVEWNEKIYKVSLQKDINALYLLDITEYATATEEYEKTRPVVGWLFLDNYDEITQGLDDRGISGFDSLLTTYFSNWGKQHGIFYKRISDDRYFLLLDREKLDRLEKDKFNIIDNVRDRTSKRNLPLTISIGLSYGEAPFDKLADLAQSNLDLALGRGGDQAIVKAVDEEPRYYGGKTNPMEKRTRVRSRMISQAMQKLMKDSDKIFVMGHKNPDMDSVGSSLGVARIAMMLKKEVYVVIDEDDINKDVAKLIQKIKEYKQLNDNLISSKEAERLINPDDLVVLVDHHKPVLSIAPSLLRKSKRNMVIDHHRRGEEFTENPLLVYIEPYASSTAELITELFEYVSTDGEPINRIEATAMLGGIVVDTNNFSLRTGSRTFDAASYLQSVGANSTMIQRLLKEDPKNYLKRSELIQTLDYVIDGVAIAHGKNDEVYPSVTAAQTADTMLSMSGVEAAFVITRRSEETVGISARSLGKINVQTIMEKMGGGGHLSNAATQIDDRSISEVIEELKEVIHSQLD